jgi:hypothetical protein
MRIAECRIRLAREVRMHEAPQLRGFFGRKFEDEVLMHNHGKDGQLIYQYPRIQFKVVQSNAIVLGVGDGADVLERLWLDVDQTTLGDEQLAVLESRFEIRDEEIAICEQPITYRFLTPWLALNQKNFQSYARSDDTRFRRDELSRILVGNCLSLAKSLGIRFQDTIEADARQLTSMKTTLKGQVMIGFVGKFQMNVKLPDLIGLGKSVSRGFGAISAETK